MKNLVRISLLIAVTGILLASCKKKDDDTNTDTNTAGKGGASLRMVIPQHHGKNIDSCTIYIKYNAKNVPSSYDDSAKCIQAGGKPIATFSGLKKGDYYLYGKGWDTSIAQVVIGGASHTITKDDTTTIYLAVTEGD